MNLSWCYVVIHYMLQTCFDMPEHLYNPINHLTQNELMEKFNLAFYEGQNLSKIDILSTFNETEEDSVTNGTEINDCGYTSDDYLIDYLISNSPVSTPSSDVDLSFDFDDFVADFDQSVSQSQDNIKSSRIFQVSSLLNTDSTNEQQQKKFAQLLCVPSRNSEENLLEESFDDVDIDLSDDLINSSLDPSDIHTLGETLDDQDQDQSLVNHPLPSVGTISRNNVDFNNFLRSFPSDRVERSVPTNSTTSIKSEFGHLIGVKCINNNFSTTGSVEETNFYSEKTEDNQKVLLQNEALLNDDPLLSFSNIMYSSRKKFLMNKNHNCEVNENPAETSSYFQCRWEGCYQVHDSQETLVKHIEKCHVEIKRGEEFTCFWENCPRKTKPFNARYKLLIHMRVHSGEKPNKCPYKGCNKAFSRLENLKIHQRSHTGERPYLCQFPNCTKSFSNSSDRAKHQRTHFDTKPYACQVIGCTKKYTDPSSLRKHVKNHTFEEQKQIKKKGNEEPNPLFSTQLVKKYLDINKQKAIKFQECNNTNFEHSYSSSYILNPVNVKQDLKNKLFERNRQHKLC